MIDETELSELLQQAGTRFEPPADGPDRIVAAADRRGAGDEDVRPRVRWWRAGSARWGVAVAGVAALAAVALAVQSVVLDDDKSTRAEPVAASAGALSATGEGTGGGPVGDDDLAEFSADVGGAGSSVAEPTSGSPDEGLVEHERTSMEYVSRPVLSVSRTSGTAGPRAATGGGTAAATENLGQVGGDAKVVKTGSVEVEVREGAFGRAVDRITSSVVGLGGFVAESTTREEDPAASGTVTVRVPAASFEDLLAQVRRLGEVRTVTVKGEDVTAQYRDLQARLTALTAAREQFLVLLRRAQSVPDILSVQDRVNQVQREIEQAQGEINLLNDRTTFATLAVALYEPGARPPESPAPEEERSGFAGAWDDAVDGFVGGMEAVVAASGVGLFVLLVGGVLWLGGRNVWRRRRRLV